jgi:hypothetical protein
MKQKLYRWALLHWGHCNGHIYHMPDGRFCYLWRLDWGNTHWQEWITISSS